MDQSKEAWMLLSNCPKGCRLKKCYNISPTFDYCSADVKHRHLAEHAEEKRALAEQAEVERAPAEQKKKPKVYHIGTRDGIGKSVHFWVNEEAIYHWLCTRSTVYQARFCCIPNVSQTG